MFLGLMGSWKLRSISQKVECRAEGFYIGIRGNIRGDWRRREEEWERVAVSPCLHWHLPSSTLAPGAEEEALA